MWIPHGFHMDTTWFTYRHQVVSSWTPHGFNVDTMWFPVAQVNGHYIVNTTQHEKHMVSMWKPYGFHVKTTGFQVDKI